MPGALKLPQKLMILVSVPLVFGLLFTGILTVLLNQADEQIRLDQRTNSVLTAAKLLSLYVDDAMMYMAGYSVTHSQTTLTRYRKSIDEIIKVQSELKALIGNEPAETKTLAKIDASITELLRIFSMTKYGSDNLKGGDRDRSLGMQLYAMIQKTLTELRTDLTELTQDARLLQESAKSDSRPIINSVLIAGILLNILLTLALTNYLGKNFGRRLNLLSQNAVLLAAGKELNKPDQGTDEIAKLDAVFHTMAATMAESSRKERATIENAIDVICSIDSDGRFANINPAASVVWGYEPAELVGRRYVDILPPADIERVRNAIETAATERGNCTFEAPVVKKGGEQVEMSWNTRWSEIEKSLFCVAHDISERKRAEKLRKEIDQMKQDFVAMVSHDLRTPLGSVQATLTMIEEGVYGNLNDKGVARLTSAQQSVQRLTGLVNNLLDLEKMESGTLTIVMEPSTLKKIVDESIDSVKPHAEQQQVSIESQCDDAELMVDSDRLVQVVINLLSNAIKFSSKNSSIELEAKTNNEFAEIRITDHGRGIPLEMRESIFEKFKQVESADGKRGKGTGLGLPICKAIVEAHNGQIGVESDEGKGSTFWFRIPLQTQT